MSVEEHSAQPLTKRKSPLKFSLVCFEQNNYYCLFSKLMEMNIIFENPNSRTIYLTMAHFLI